MIQALIGPIANLAGTWLEGKVETKKAETGAKVAKAKAEAVIMEKKATGEIVALSDWVFLDPIKPESPLKSSVLEIVSFETPRNEKGRIKYASDKIKEHGLEVGDVVYFQKDADYEMQIEDETLWRMLVQHLMVAEK